jgi:hypothetical protein
VKGLIMQKIEVINAELTRLHNTYNALLNIVSSITAPDELYSQLLAVQDKIAVLHAILDEYQDDYDRYSVSDLMDEDEDDED